MYSTCVHCHGSLDTNESIERFPVGRRIAFDAARGRLWAVCAKCERWNLSPLETRWEAIEECERAFRDTRVRVSTDNIGLAKLREGTELIRVGNPMRPEFAAWRYGDQFGRRRRKFALYSACAVAGVGVLAAGGIAAGVSFTALTQIGQLGNYYNLFTAWQRKQRGFAPMPVVQIGDGTWVAPMGQLKLAARADVEEGWGVTIGMHPLVPGAALPRARRWRRGVWMDVQAGATIETRDIRGNDAESVLRWALLRANRTGASRRAVQEGVGLIEVAGDPARFGTWVASQLPAWRAKMTFVDGAGQLDKIPSPARLAFEMSLHEESERRALEGELHVLEAAWRQADEIAKIADDMFVPEAVQSKLESLRDSNRES
ncbi:MAG TPA: hypothetical protein VE869_01535 [Gemmatimonas sp.]|nr:hypothetical protein [Gemmatimonas sp.]